MMSCLPGYRLIPTLENLEFKWMKLLNQVLSQNMNHQHLIWSFRWDGKISTRWKPTCWKPTKLRAPEVCQVDGFPSFRSVGRASRRPSALLTVAAAHRAGGAERAVQGRVTGCCEKVAAEMLRLIFFKMIRVCFNRRWGMQSWSKSLSWTTISVNFPIISSQVQNVQSALGWFFFLLPYSNNIVRLSDKSDISTKGFYTFGGGRTKARNAINPKHFEEEGKLLTVMYGCG